MLCSGFILALAETASSILFRWTIGGSGAAGSQARCNSLFTPRSYFRPTRVRHQRPVAGAACRDYPPFLNVYLI